MPQSQELRSFTFPGQSFVQRPSPTTFESALTFTKSLSALLAAQCDGSLTTRTDDDTGVVTLSTGHGIETADVVDVYWSGGMRYGMTATVSGVEITVDGGAGDNLPAEDTAITAVVEQTTWEINFDGDDAQVVAVVYRNGADTGAKAHIDLQDATPATIEELDLVHEAVSGGLDHITDIANGDTNIYSGNRITAGKVSHDSQQAGTVYVMVGLVALS